MASYVSMPIQRRYLISPQTPFRYKKAQFRSDVVPQVGLDGYVWDVWDTEAGIAGQKNE
jgi:hypothetical protein